MRVEIYHTAHREVLAVFTERTNQYEGRLLCPDISWRIDKIEFERYVIRIHVSAFDAEEAP